MFVFMQTFFLEKLQYDHCVHPFIYVSLTDNMYCNVQPAKPAAKLAD